MYDIDQLKVKHKNGTYVNVQLLQVVKSWGFMANMTQCLLIQPCIQEISRFIQYINVMKGIQPKIHDIQQ